MRLMRGHIHWYSHPRIKYFYIGTDIIDLQTNNEKLFVYTSQQKQKRPPAKPKTKMVTIYSGCGGVLKLSQ